MLNDDLCPVMMFSEGLLCCPVIPVEGFCVNSQVLLTGFLVWRLCCWEFCLDSAYGFMELFGPLAWIQVEGFYWFLLVMAVGLRLWLSRLGFTGFYLTG